MGGTKTALLKRSSAADISYGLVSALYVGGLAGAPAGLFVAGFTGVSTAVAWAAMLGVGLLVGVAAGVAVIRRPALSVQLGASGVRPLLAFMPIVGLPIGLSVNANPAVDSSDPVVAAAGPVWLSLILVGALLWTMSRTRYARSMGDESTVLVHAEPLSERRRWAQYGLAVAVLGVGLAVSIRAPNDGLLDMVGTVVAASSFTAVTSPRRPSRVTEAGIETTTPLGRDVLQWSAFSGYEETDDGVVVHSARWGAPDLRFDREDTDIEALLSVLAERNIESR